MYPQQEIIKNILETFDQSAIVQFREFLAKQPNVTKWMIASDYCLHDSDRPQDVMSFAIIPYDDWFDKIKKEIGAAIPCDIKKARDIGNPAITYFRKQTIFHVSFILSKDGTLLTNGPGSNKLAIARESIKITIEHLVEMDLDQADIRKLRALALDAQSNGFNTKLFSDVLLLSVLFPFITLIIARERSVEIVGWFSDRDSMTKWHDGVVWTFAYENTRGIGGFLGIDIDSAKITVALPDMSSGKEEMWYDNFIRIADYFAGAIAAWDTVANGVKHKKHARMLRDVIADAPNVVIMKLTIGHYGMQCARLDV